MFLRRAWTILFIKAIKKRLGAQVLLRNYKMAVFWRLELATEETQIEFSFYSNTKFGVSIPITKMMKRLQNSRNKVASPN